MDTQPVYGLRDTICLHLTFTDLQPSAIMSHTLKLLLWAPR